MADARLDRRANGSGGDVAAADDDSPRARTQARDDLGELRLPVAGDGRDPDDLARMDLERHAPDGGQAAVVEGGHILDGQDDGSRLHRRALQRLEDRPPDHATGEVGTRHPAGVDAGGRDLAGAHDGDPVGDRQHLAELVADEDDAPSGVRQRPQVLEQLGGLLGREDGRGLVEDEDASPVEQHLHDLDALLLADRQLPDPGAGLDAQADVRRETRDLGLGPLEVEAKSWPVEAEEDVLGHGLRRDQREMLVDHADAGGDRIPWRAQLDRLAADPDRALVGPIQAREHVHERALACPVLAQQGMDLADAHVEVDVVVGDDARERLDDPDRLDGERGRRSGLGALRTGHGPGGGSTSGRRSGARSRISISRAAAARR